MPGRTSAAWSQLAQWWSTLADLQGAAALSAWDRETLMPPAGADARARQLGTLATLRHREMIRPEVDDALEIAADGPTDERQRAMLRLAHRARRRAVALPEDLVRATSEAGSRGVSAWLEARERNDFALFAPALGHLVELKRAEAEALAVGDEPYDALLDEFEPGTRAVDLEPIFADLQARLAPLVAEASSRPAVHLPAREWPADGQVAMALLVAELIGFDRTGGVIARSAHPFTSATHRGDVRFTTRVDPDDPISSISAVMHEGGHALYEQGFPADGEDTPLYDSPSLGAHESQSRFWENHVGRTGAFWARLEPHLRRTFPEAMAGIDAELLHRAGNVVRPSLIRVEADEVTYNLHIVLRFELELALVRGDLAVADLPAAFADGMERLVGVRPSGPADGAMQDIHWADGLFGYFPTYTLGSLYAAQLAQAADAALGGLDAAIEEGRFADILSFARERIHRHGSLYPTPELMRRATGSELSADALIDHLRRTYTAE